jgi:hypothetical protein
MKSLIKNFLKSVPIIYLRNTLKKSEVHSIIKNNDNISISDSFLWRTDNNFETKFIFSDILGFYLNTKETLIEIQIFSKYNILIKKLLLKDLKNTNELLINKNFLDGLEDFGSFYIFHFTKKKFKEKTSISNRCYIGYKNINNFYSYIHGNMLARSRLINQTGKYDSQIIQKSLLNNQQYKIQKNFVNYDYSELFFTNFFDKKIILQVNENKYEIQKGCTIKINIKKVNLINLKSNIMFFRPTVFSYRKKFMDVHHS